jgi:hypothetical protein
VEQDADGTATFVALGAGAQLRAVLGTVRRPSGRGALGTQTADDQHLAFVYLYGAGEDVQNAWTLYLWSRGNGLRAIAHNPTDSSGQPISGGFVLPLLSGRYLYWIQATLVGAIRKQAGSALMQYDITTRRTRVIYSGLVTAAVPYHQQVLFAGASAAALLAGHGKNPPTTLHAADQSTGAAVAPPPGLDIGSDDPFQMVTNGDLIAWDSDNGGLRAWRPAWRHTRTLMPSLTDPDLPSRLAEIAQTEDLGIYGHFITWNSPYDYVFDWRTGSITALTTHHGTVDLSGRRLQLWQYTSSNPPTNPNGPYTYSAYLLDLSTLPDLPACR